MDDPNRKLSRCGTQIEDLPSCLIIEILLRLPTKPLLISRLVCKSWFLLFSDPLFVKLHRARSPTYLLHRKARETWKLRCTNLVGEMAGENFEFEANVTLPDSKFTCANSCNGLLCLENCKSRDEIYVCNPILGEYVTIPIGNTETMRRVKSVLGFSSRSNQFKVLQINIGIAPYMAEIYTIGNGTRHWKSFGIAPSCPNFVFDGYYPNSFLNGSIHWTDGKTHQIVYFDFESEQFGSLPSPPAWRDGRWSELKWVRVGVLDGCLCIYAFGYLYGPQQMEQWMMKEYGVEESWTRIFSTRYIKLGRRELLYLLNKDSRLMEHWMMEYGGEESWTRIFPTLYSKLERHELLLNKDSSLIQLGAPSAATYNPSFISLQDVAKDEQLTILSRTRVGKDYRISDQDSLEVFSNILS